MSDYHVHLHEHGPFRGHGPPPGEYPPGHIESYVERALANGLHEVGFTEHLYRCIESGPLLGAYWEDAPHSDLAADTEKMVREDRTLSIEAYVAAVVAAKERGLPVKLGLEVDFFPESFDVVLEFLAPYPWDFLIGAVHWVGGWSIDYEVSAYEFDRRGIRQAYEDYFQLKVQLAASGGVDVLAHVDVVKKHGHFLPQPPIDLYREVVSAAVGSGTAVEVSSAGLHSSGGEMYPAPQLLRMFNDAGVGITLASDAHVPQHCGRDVPQVIEAARAAGFRDHLAFDARVATSHPLP